MNRLSSFVCCGLLLISISASAQQIHTQSSRTLSYQGLLQSTSDNVRITGDREITVHFYTDAAGTQEVWRDTYATHILQGVFSLELGSGTVPLPGSDVMSHSLWLGIQIGGDDVLWPLTSLSAAPVALSVTDNSITKDNMATDFVGSIAINGQTVSGKGGTVNFVTGDGIDASLDPAKNTIVLKASASGLQKGASSQSSDNYILNQTTQESNANFNISGSGTIGSTLNVSGNTALGGTLAVSGASTTTGVTNTGNITNSGAVSTGTLAVSGASTTTGVTNTGNITNSGAVSTGTLAVSGASTTNGITNGGSLSVSGTTTLVGNTEIDGVLTLDGLTHLPLPISGIIAVDASNHIGYRTPAEIFTTAAGNWILNQNSAPQLANFQIGGSGAIGTTLTVGGASTFHGLLAMNGNSITTVANPTNAQDAATKIYVDNETSRALGAESTLTTNLASEVTRAGTAEAANAAAITTETARATGAESTLTTNLASEVTRAGNAEAANASAITTETTRATGAESTLTTNLASEVTRAGTAEAANAAAITTETARATGAESTLTTNLAGEVARAGNAEAANASAITTETARAMSAESTNATAISTEATRAQGAEATLTTNLASEVTRAGNAEAANAADISTETTRAQAAEATNAAAVSAEAVARTTAVNNEAAARTAADNTLQANINTEASTRATAVTSAIATAENYTDNAIATEVTDRNAAIAASAASTLGSANVYTDAAVATEAASRTTEETSLQNNIDAEETARTAADNTLQSNINTEASAREDGDAQTLSSANTYTDNAIAGSAANYIANSTNQQSSANFNIDGNGTMGSATVSSLSNYGLVYADASSQLTNDNALIWDYNNTRLNITVPPQNYGTGMALWGASPGISFGNFGAGALGWAGWSQDAGANDMVLRSANGANLLLQSGTGHAGVVLDAGNNTNIKQTIYSDGWSVTNDGTASFAFVSGDGSALTNITAANLNGTLSVPNGGTGVTSLNTNEVLLGNGSSEITSVPAGSEGQVLSINGGVPMWQSLSGNFIQNGTAPQTSANFNIDGNGVIGNHFEVAGYTSLNGQLNVAGTTTAQSSVYVMNNASTYPGDAQPSALRATAGVGDGGWYGLSGFGGYNNTAVAGELFGNATIGGHNASLSTWSDLYINPGPGNIYMGYSGYMTNIGGFLEADNGANFNFAVMGSAYINSANIDNASIANANVSYLNIDQESVNNLDASNLITIGTQTPDPYFPSPDTRLRLRGTYGNSDTYDYGVVSNGDLGYVESYYDQYGFYLDDDNNNGAGVSFTINHGSPHDGSPIQILGLDGWGNLAVPGAMSANTFSGDGSNLSNISEWQIPNLLYDLASKEDAANVTNDARAAFSAGTGIDISDGVISATGGGNAFINNSGDQQADANFNIDGSGTIGAQLFVNGFTTLNNQLYVNGLTSTNQLIVNGQADINTNGGWNTTIGDGYQGGRVNIQSANAISIGDQSYGGTTIGSSYQGGRISIQSPSSINIGDEGYGATTIGNGFQGGSISLQSPSSINIGDQSAGTTNIGNSYQGGNINLQTAPNKSLNIGGAYQGGYVNIQSQTGIDIGNQSYGSNVNIGSYFGGTLALGGAINISEEKIDFQGDINSDLRFSTNWYAPRTITIDDDYSGNMTSLNIAGQNSFSVGGPVSILGGTGSSGGDVTISGGQGYNSIGSVSIDGQSVNVGMQGFNSNINIGSPWSASSVSIEGQNVNVETQGFNSTINIGSQGYGTSVNIQAGVSHSYSNGYNLYSVESSDYYVNMGYAPGSVYLPTSPTPGRTIVIIDESQSSTIFSQSGPINYNGGSANSYSMSGISSITLVSDGYQWFVTASN